MKSVLGFIFLVGCVAANFWDNLNSMRDAPVAPLPQNFSMSVSTDSTLLNITAEFSFEGTSDSAQLKVITNVLNNHEKLLFAVSAYNSSIYFQQQDKECLILPINNRYLPKTSIGNLMALAPLFMSYKSYNKWKKQHTFILGNVTNDFLISPHSSVELVFDKDLNLKRVNAITGKNTLTLDVLNPIKSTQFEPSYFKITDTCRIMTEDEKELMWERLRQLIRKTTQIMDTLKLYP